jgi:hypothetical protein
MVILYVTLVGTICIDSGRYQCSASQIAITSDPSLYVTILGGLRMVILHVTPVGTIRVGTWLAQS